MPRSRGPVSSRGRPLSTPVHIVWFNLVAGICTLLLVLYSVCYPRQMCQSGSRGRDGSQGGHDRQVEIVETVETGLPTGIPRICKVWQGLCTAFEESQRWCLVSRLLKTPNIGPGYKNCPGRPSSLFSRRMCLFHIQHSNIQILAANRYSQAHRSHAFLVFSACFRALLHVLPWRRELISHKPLPRWPWCL